MVMQSRLQSGELEDPSPRFSPVIFRGLQGRRGFSVFFPEEEGKVSQAESKAKPALGLLYPEAQLTLFWRPWRSH